MFEEFLISGLSIQKETYAQRENRRECWTDNVNPNLFFVDGPMNDPRHTDIEMIGEIHDVTFGQLASVFAKDDRDYERLQDIYKTPVTRTISPSSTTRSRATIMTLTGLWPRKTPAYAV